MLRETVLCIFLIPLYILMHLIVFTSDMMGCTLDVDDNISTRGIFEAIERKLDIPTGQQKITFPNQQTYTEQQANNANISDLSLSNKNTLYVQRTDSTVSRLTNSVPQDDFNAESQRIAYEKIQAQNLSDNIALGYEHNPESLVPMPLLYVQGMINQVPLKALIDTGAQMSIMSQECAEKCGLIRLLDRRFQGIARGIGSGCIIGRVHMALLQLHDTSLPITLTIVEKISTSDINFILGIDQLRRHQACIDLKTLTLRIEDVSIPFVLD